MPGDVRRQVIGMNGSITQWADRSGSVRPVQGKRPRGLASVAGQMISPPEFSDVSLASAFAAGALPNFRWSPGLGWMVFNGVVWERDERLQRYALAKRICCEIASSSDDHGEARRIASAKTINAVISLAQSDQNMVVSAEIWDKDPLLLNTPAGIVDLRTGGMRPLGSEYVTQAARVGPDSTQGCPTWHRFLDSVFMADGDLIEFMRRSLGYMLTGDRTEQVLWFWHGVGANGKSVLAELVQWIGSGYALKLPASVLMQARGERHPTELAQLRGKRLAVSSELDENSFFNEPLIKELTGDNTLTARFMRADFFQFVMTHKHVIVGNFKPRLRGGDAAIARRMILVPFNASFAGAERDPDMLAKLKAEAPAILAWMIQGAAAWFTEGLAIPAAVLNASADYMRDNDDLKMWMDECCLRTGEAGATDLYRSFCWWKKERGETAPSLTVWGARLSSDPKLEKRRSGGIKYTGISLTEAATRRLLQTI